MNKRIFAIDPGATGASLMIELHDSLERHELSAQLRVAVAGDIIGPGVVTPWVLNNLPVEAPDAVVIEGQFGNGYAVRHLAETVGAWKLAVGVAWGIQSESVVLATWSSKNAVGKAVKAFLAGWPAMPFRPYRIGLPSDINAAVELTVGRAKRGGKSELKRVAPMLAASLLPEHALRPMINRDGYLRDGPTDAFLLGVGAWLKEGKL